MGLSKNAAEPHNNLYLRLHNWPYLLWHWPFCSSLVFMEIFTSTLSANFHDSVMETVEVPERLMYSMHVFTARRKRWRCFSRWSSCRTPALCLWRSSPWWCSANANARTGVPGAAPPISAATKAVQTSSVCKSLPLHFPWKYLMDNAEKSPYFCH